MFAYKRQRWGQAFDSQIKEQVLGPEGKVLLIILHDAFCGVNEGFASESGTSEDGSLAHVCPGDPGKLSAGVLQRVKGQLTGVLCYVHATRFQMLEAEVLQPCLRGNLNLTAPTACVSDNTLDIGLRLQVAWNAPLVQDFISKKYL